MVYTVTMHTGERLLVASDLRIEVTLISSSAKKAGPFSLRSKFGIIERHHGEHTEIHKFDAEQDIGEIVAIQVHANRGWRSLFTDLFINSITVRQTSRGIEMFVPIYSWIQKGDNRTFFGGVPTLPNDPKLTDSMLELRSADIAYHQSVYDSTKFARITGLPSGLRARYQDLPADEQFESLKGRQVLSNVIKKILETGVADLFGHRRSWGSLEEFKSALFGPNGSLLSPIAETWDTDDTMGRQYLCGINPAFVKLCAGSFPEKFPVTDKVLKSKVAILRDKDIQTEMQAGKFCYVDFRPLLQDLVDIQARERAQGVNDHQNSYLAAAVCLFYYSEPINTIVPVAIQLKQGGKMYYPTVKDDSEFQKNEWIMAKMFVNNADAQIHQLCTHFMGTHMVIEAYAIAARRTLSSSHPLFRLLKPHLQWTSAINSLARQRLLPTIESLFSIGHQMFPLIQRAYSLWTYEFLSPLHLLKQNGFTDGIKSPLVDTPGAYPWREDVLLIYEAIHEFTSKYVNHYYKGDDKLVAADAEISNWRLELLEVLPKKNYPQIDTCQQLIDMTANVIFAATAGHAPINFNQYEYYSWVPNHPAVMRLGLPEDIKVPITTEILLDAIPNVTQTVQSIALARSLSEYADEEVFLGKAEPDLSDPAARVIHETFNAKLDEITVIIKKRNETSRAKDPYIWLMPQMISNSIAI